MRALFVVAVAACLLVACEEEGVTKSPTPGTDAAELDDGGVPIKGYRDSGTASGDATSSSDSMEAQEDPLPAWVAEKIASCDSVGGRCEPAFLEPDANPGDGHHYLLMAAIALPSSLFPAMIISKISIRSGGVSPTTPLSENTKYNAGMPDFGSFYQECLPGVVLDRGDICAFEVTTTNGERVVVEVGYTKGWQGGGAGVWTVPDWPS